jgi:hypothetical protein
MRRIVALLAGFWLALSVAGTPALSQEGLQQREALAREIISNPLTLREQREIEAGTIDGVTRRVFKKLGTTSDWGPDHPDWQRIFPEFAADYSALFQSYLPNSLEQLRGALARRFTENELREILVKLNDGDFAAVKSAMAALGMGMLVTMRLSSFLNEPSLYSKAERAELSALAQSLRSKGPELAALNERLAFFQNSPSVVRYLQVEEEVRTEFARRFQTDEQFRRRISEFSDRWEKRMASRVPGAPE